MHDRNCSGMELFLLQVAAVRNMEEAAAYFLDGFLFWMTGGCAWVWGAEIGIHH
jgi:hypothetical protein